jgi:membrane protein YqaA with SNARE-associated domain
MRVLVRELPLYWQRFGWALVGFAGVGALILYAAPALAGLFLFSIYSTPANSLLPVPHEPGLLYFAHYYDPVWIALAGAVGTAVAACIDYPVVKSAFRHPKIRRARDTQLYRSSVRWLLRWPFLTIVAFAATPLPVYVVRVLAPATGYPLWRYMAATMVGRFPRYYLMAWVGHLYHIPAWALLALFVFMVGTMVLGSKVSDDVGIDGLEVLEASGATLPIVTDAEADAVVFSDPAPPAEATGAPTRPDR